MGQRADPWDGEMRGIGGPIGLAGGGVQQAGVFQPPVTPPRAMGGQRGGFNPLNLFPSQTVVCDVVIDSGDA